MCHTNGAGFWSSESKAVEIIGIDLFYINKDNSYAELRARFIDKCWNNEKDGLIYTDPNWIKDFRLAIKKQFKLSGKAVLDITYSEQGMQGINFVSMDVGKTFLKEWLQGVWNIW